MTLRVEFWELVTLMVTVLLGIAGIFITLGKVTLAQSQRHLDMRFDAMDAAHRARDEQLARRLEAIESARRDEVAQWQRVERDLYQLKVELPQRYVQREDYVRGQTIVEAKLDALAAKLDSVQIRAAAAHVNREGA